MIIENYIKEPDSYWHIEAFDKCYLIFPLQRRKIMLYPVVGWSKHALNIDSCPPHLHSTILREVK